MKQPLYKKDLLVGKARRSRINGPANCQAYVNIELREGENGTELSICGEIWNHLKTDVFLSGQCLDDMPDFISLWLVSRSKFERIREVWKRWHLNDLNPGCEHQRALMPIIIRERGDDFFNISNYDAIIDLPVFGYCPFCDGYIYGSAWLHEELPAEIVEEVKSW